MWRLFGPYLIFNSPSFSASGGDEAVSHDCGVSSVSSLMLVKFNICSYLLLAEAAHPHSLINVFAVFLKKHWPQQTHNVATASLQRCCNVVTLQRRCNDVVCLLRRL